MNKRNPRTFSVLAAGNVGEDGLAWIEVLPTADKARNGPYYFTVTREDLDAAAAAIKQDAARIPIDRDHPDPENGDSTRAAGWFTGETQVVDVGDTNPQGNLADHASVWAQVKWTPSGLNEVQNGEYRYLSPEWSFHNRDKKSGLMTKFKEMAAVTLTNRPFFTDLAPVTAADLDDDAAISAFATEHELKREDLLRALADVAPETPLSDVLAAMNTPTPKPEPSKEDAVNPEVLKALGLAEDASSEEILTAVTDLKEKVEITESFDMSVLEQLTKVTARELDVERQLARKHRETEQARSERDRDDMLAKAVELGRILPVHKAFLKAVHANDPDGFKALIESSPARSFKEIGTGEGTDSDERPSPREIADKRGNVVARVEDSEWLHNRAVGILLENGKTMKTASRDEYLNALDEATERATR